MADVFISYSKQHAQFTRDLADALVARGLTVWWDTELTSGKSFSAEINQQLDDAKAVVVIWSPTGVKSEWIVSEAERGRQQEKLVSLLAPGVKPTSLPVPFNMVHAVPVDDMKAIMAALQKLKLAADPVEQRWQQIAGSTDARLLGDFAKANAGHPRAAEALARIGEIDTEEERAWQQLRGSELPHQYNGFIKKWPNGVHAQEARERLRAFGIWGTIAAYGEASVGQVVRLFAVGMASIFVLVGAVVMELPAFALAAIKMGPVVALNLAVRNASQIGCTVGFKSMCVCGAGQTRDAATGACKLLSETPPAPTGGRLGQPVATCANGEFWSSLLSKCIALSRSCPPGQLWDALQGSCRVAAAAAPIAPQSSCMPGDFFDPLTQKCTQRIRPSTMQLLCIVDPKMQWNPATLACEKRP